MRLVPGSCCSPSHGQMSHHLPQPHGTLCPVVVGCTSLGKWKITLRLWRDPFKSVASSNTLVPGNWSQSVLQNWWECYRIQRAWLITAVSPGGYPWSGLGFSFTRQYPLWRSGSNLVQLHVAPSPICRKCCVMAKKRGYFLESTVPWRICNIHRNLSFHNSLFIVEKGYLNLFFTWRKKWFF